jgi:hypothetical protein
VVSTRRLRNVTALVHFESGRRTYVTGESCGFQGLRCPICLSTLIGHSLLNYVNSVLRKAKASQGVFRDVGLQDKVALERLGARGRG